MEKSFDEGRMVNEDRKIGRLEGRQVNEGRKIGGLEDRPVTFKFVNSLPSYPPTLQPSKKAAFTLAEVLITLAIIGVVAALTIPTLITKMSQKAAEARTKTIEARLLDGINRYSTLEDGLSQSYETTYDFLVGLSKHYKMAQICKADEITNCVPYSTINYTQDGEDKSVEVSTLTSIGSFISGDAAEDYLAPASFITGQGTPVVMAFKKDCVWDSGKAMRDIADSGCIAYMYDENGTRNPNKIGKDWQNNGLTIVAKEAVPIAIVGGYKIMNKSFRPTSGLSKSECETEKTKNYGIETCADDIDSWSAYNGDVWAAAMKYCHDKGWHLPDEDESFAIALNLFYNVKTNDKNDHPDNRYWDYDTYKIDLDLINTLNIKNVFATDELTQDNVTFDIYLNIESDDTTGRRRNIRDRDTGTYGISRRSSPIQVLCISD